jgi:RecA-family ATPase
MFYICSMPNDGQGRVVGTFVDSTGKRDAFAEQHDQPGRSVYQSVAVHKAGSTRRCLDTVDYLELLHVDVDLRLLVTPPEEVLRKLKDLDPSLELRESGGGYHLIGNLKEPVYAGTDEFRRAEAARTALTRICCGDPAPNHSAALLRVPGTTNSKYDPPRPCRVIREGSPIDLTEIETLVELYGDEQLFEPKPAEKANGHDGSAEETFRPLDVDYTLENMPTTGEGINKVQPPLLRKLLVQRALYPGEAVEMVVDATMAMSRRTNNGWTQELERKRVHERMNSVLRRLQEQHWQAVAAGNIGNDTPPSWLWVEAHEGWIDRCRQDERPHVLRNGAGYCIRKAAHQADNGEATNEAGETTEANEKPATKKREFVLRAFVPFDPAQLPPRQWLYGRHYQRRTVSATIAPGGFGKTTLDMVEAIAMATCQNLLGEQPTERLRVWYHNGEDSLEELHRRVAAVCQHFNIPQEELRDWFFMTSGNEVPLRVATGYSDLRIDQPLISLINKNIEQNGIDLATLDPLITLHGVPETDNTKMDMVIRIFAGIADAQNCGVELAHHTRKMPAGNGGDYGGADMRGASATHDAVRAVRVLNRMSDSDAKDLGILEHERARYFRIDKAKGNNSAAAKAVWRQFQNIELPNGDEVGVVMAWDYPGQGQGTAEAAEAERAADHVFMQLLTRFTITGRVASDRGGRNYAPTLFAKEPTAKVAKVNKVMLENAMVRLFAAGKIRAVDEGSGGHRVHKIVAEIAP